MKSRRQEEILRWVANVGSLTVEEAIGRFSGSAATIRRDFNQLAREKVVRRVRGGIALAEEGPMRPFAVREVCMPAEKLRIAKKAAALLQPGDVIFVDGGTTTQQLASCLPPFELRVLTNSLCFAETLERRIPARNRWELFLTGGFLFPHSGLLVGPTAQAGVAKYHADWAFMSASSVSCSGVYNDNEHVVESERLMIAHSEKTVVLADRSKFGRRAMCHIAKLEALDYLITDHAVDDETLRDSCTKHHVNVIVA